jgi:hypothetical protein
MGWRTVGIAVDVSDLRSVVIIMRGLEISVFCSALFLVEPRVTSFVALLAVNESAVSSILSGSALAVDFLCETLTLGCFFNFGKYCSIIGTPLEQHLFTVDVFVKSAVEDWVVFLDTFEQDKFPQHLITYFRTAPSMIFYDFKCSRNPT